MDHQNPNSLHESTPNAPEQSAEVPLSAESMPQTPEKEVKHEAAPTPERASTPPALTLPPVQIPNNSMPSDDSTPASDDVPSTADDVEVIEQAWVSKAKKIIEETKDNPYEQEKAVERLQIEYLKKRYGKEIKQTRE